RAPGVRGAALAERSLSILREAVERYSRSSAPLVIPILSTLPKAAYQIDAECPPELSNETRTTSSSYIEREFKSECSEDLTRPDQTSWSGWWRIRTTVQHARPIRYVRGVLRNGGRFLETDPESYTDGVLSAEGAGLPRSARDA